MTIYTAIKDGEVKWPGNIVWLKKGDLVATVEDTEALIDAHKKADNGRRIVMENEGLKVAQELGLIEKQKEKRGKKL